MADNLSKAIAGANDRWNEAFNTGDIRSMAALYTGNATVLPHTHDVIQGTEKIQAFWQSLHEAGFKEHSIELIEVHSKGDMAYEVGKWAAKGPGENGETQAFGGSLTNIYEKQADGSWKCCLHIWN